MPERSILDARLAEIDRRLRTIQSELAPAPESAGRPSSFPAPTLVPPPDSPRSGLSEPPGPPRPPTPESPPAPPGPGSHLQPASDAQELVAQLRQLVAAQERWLAWARELLVAHDLPPAAGQAFRPSAVPATGPVGVSAGPFSSTEALRRFERALSSLPEVRDVVRREYAGDDRVVVDVHLFGPIS